jgi:hypothetical protein
MLLTCRNKQSFVLSYTETNMVCRVVYKCKKWQWTFTCRNEQSFVLSYTETNMVCRVVYKCKKWQWTFTCRNEQSFVLSYTETNMVCCVVYKCKTWQWTFTCRNEQRFVLSYTETNMVCRVVYKCNKCKNQISAQYIQQFVGRTFTCRNEQRFVPSHTEANTGKYAIMVSNNAFMQTKENWRGGVLFCKLFWLQRMVEERVCDRVQISLSLHFYPTHSHHTNTYRSQHRQEVQSHSWDYTHTKLLIDLLTYTATHEIAHIHSHSWNCSHHRVREQFHEWLCMWAVSWVDVCVSNIMSDCVCEWSMSGCVCEQFHEWLCVWAILWVAATHETAHIHSHSWDC